MVFRERPALLRCAAAWMVFPILCMMSVEIRVAAAVMRERNVPASM